MSDPELSGITEAARAAFAGGRGPVTVLFAGESGTGKTLAAEALARELGVALHRSIGETEKQGPAVVLLDEADALFGKRLASLAGGRPLLVIVATSAGGGDLDPAQLAEIDFVVDFPA